MWDLVKGRCTYTTRLEVEAEGVAFCPEGGGTRYALLCGAALSLHSVQGDEGGCWEGGGWAAAAVAGGPGGLGAVCMWHLSAHADVCAGVSASLAHVRGTRVLSH